VIDVACIFGTRPEAIKMAPVIKQLQKHQGQFRLRTYATAQHREMLDQVLHLFGIVPDVDLDLMEEGQTPSGVASRVLVQLDVILRAEQPHWVLVQGDTTTVMASAIAAHHLRIRVGHVEAGLRTGDRWNPFPEEMNRVLADHLSDLCFAPTERARANLLQEGIPEHMIRLTGNTVIDALLDVAARPWEPEPGGPLARILDHQDVILVTAHRRESFGRPLEQICEALRRIAHAAAGAVHLLYPVHPNPSVQEPVTRLLNGVPHITLLPPLNYLTLVQVMRHSKLILTDSGGIQEEAPAFGVPVLVLREVTERPEAVEAGTAKVVGTDTERIVREAFALLDDQAAYDAMARAVNPFGDGHAAERIVDALLHWDAGPGPEAV
jgi:UDP-N-acetylglucosamine 2-epimerase (non-hydrolysing)